MTSKEEKLAKTNVDYDEVKRKLNQGNMVMAQDIEKPVKKGPTKSQINRLKKFYNTTRWLPNSAFTTYFGKPAFENYGYGNTNPVYGGLFYGNYMLSHNMNPIDGANHPPEKQVYSSAMMKSIQRQNLRKPSPPRKIPEEIRNTPEELQEIKTRCQIFQLPNNLPSREIIPPNLLKARYFRSGKNSPAASDEENEDEYEVWNVENVLAGKKNKVKKIKDRGSLKGYNPYKQGKVQLGKKKMKEEIDNKVDPELYRKVREKKMKGMKVETEDLEEQKSDSDIEYEVKKNYYETLLGEDMMGKLQDLKDVKIQDQISMLPIPSSNLQNMIQNEENIGNQNNFQPMMDNNINNQGNASDEEEKLLNQQILGQTMPQNTCHNCPMCSYAMNTKKNNNLGNEYKSTLNGNNNSQGLKESGGLCSCGVEGTTKNGEKVPGYMCCLHHTKDIINTNDFNPKNFKGMPPCTMKKIIPAGKPNNFSRPLNLFEQ